MQIPSFSAITSYSEELTAEEAWSRGISELGDLQLELTDILQQLKSALRNLTNLPALLPYANSTDVVAQEVLRLELAEYASQEGIMLMFKKTLLLIRDFFLKLKDKIIAFGRTLLDNNRRVSEKLNKLGYQKKWTSALEQQWLNQPTFGIASEVVTSQLMLKLTELFNDILAIDNDKTEVDLTKYSSGLQSLGYTVDITTKSVIAINPLQLDLQIQTLAKAGWTIASLQSTTLALAKLCRQGVELNKIQYRLETEVQAALRTIHTYLKLDQQTEVEAITAKLNHTSVQCSYVFKSVVIFQFYVTQLSTMLIDVWDTINNN